MAIDYITGTLQIANVFLAIVAGFVAASLYKSSAKKEFAAWRPLIAALILFSFEEIVGAIRSFGIYQSPFLTHIIPSFILGLLIWALIQQMDITRHH